MAAKKTPKMTRGKRAAMVIDRWAAMETELDRLRKQLAEANEQLKSGEVALLETAKIVSVLNQALTVEREKLAAAQHALDGAQMLIQVQADTIERHVPEMVELKKQLAAKDKEIEGADRERAGVNGTIDFLWEEIDRYRNRLMDYIHWDAMLPEDLREAVRKVRMESYAWAHDEDETR